MVSKHGTLRTSVLGLTGSDAVNALFPPLPPWRHVDTGKGASWEPFSLAETTAVPTLSYLGNWNLKANIHTSLAHHMKPYLHQDASSCYTLKAVVGTLHSTVT